MEKEKTKRRFMISVCGYLISSGVTLLMPWTENESQTIGLMGCIVGVLFWLGLVIGVLFWFLAYKSCKNTEAFKAICVSFRPGILRFFSNAQAVVSDVLLLLSLAVIIVSLCVSVNYMAGLISLCVFLFAFHMHYLLNGRVYRFLKLASTKGDSYEEKAFS